MKYCSSSRMAAWMACLAITSGSLPALPLIQSFDPVSGRPGEVVTLTGFGLDTVTRVTFGGEPAAYLIVNETRIVALVPPAALTGPMGVSSVAGATQTAASFGVAPRVGILSSLSAGTGDLVVVEGANFLANGTTVVIAGATSTVVQVVSPGQLTATVPGLATNGPVVVTTAYGTGASSNIFVRTEAPFIARVTPSNGPPGTVVSLTGANFNGTTAVRLNGRSAGINTVSEDRLTFTVPNAATSGLITVTAAGGTGSTASNFSVGPRILAFSPQRVVPGDVVRVTCSSLVGLQQVKIGTHTVPASNLRSVAEDVLDLTVPANAPSGLISLTTAVGTGEGDQPLTVGPELTAFTPAAGPVDTLVSLQGFGLLSVSGVRFGSVPATTVYANPGGLFARVPTGASNGIITVQASGGVATSSVPFLVTVGRQPNILDFAPTQGVPGIPLIIRGIQLSGATIVTVGGGAATDFVVLDDQTIEVIVPYAATNGPVTVVTPFGTAQSSQVYTTPTVLPPVLPTVAVLPVPQTARVIVSWPADLVPYRLERSPGAGPWLEVPATPVVIDGRNYVTNLMSPTVELYRLSYP